jgi:hypothetical protein
MNVMGATSEARKILVRDGFRYPILFDKAIHPAVTPGPKLDALNAAVIAEVSKAIDALVDQAPKTLKLFEWVRKQITVTSTEAVYGPKNPFRSESLQAAYWYADSSDNVVGANERSVGNLSQESSSCC